MLLGCILVVLGPRKACVFMVHFVAEGNWPFWADFKNLFLDFEEDGALVLKAHLGNEMRSHNT